MNTPINGPGKSSSGINTNTGISIGLVVIALGGFGWVIKGQNETSLTAVTTKNELVSKIDKLDNRMEQMDKRVTVLESSKNVWSLADMFKWAVHLQQLNRDPKKIQSQGLTVPEPEVATK